MTDETTKLTDLKHEIHALLIPAKRGMSIAELMDYYKKNNRNEDIPFAKFKFNSCIALLSSMPDVCCLQQYQGEMRAFAVANASTIHIQRFVQNQKNDKKKSARSSNRNYYPQPFQTHSRSNHYSPVKHEKILPSTTMPTLPVRPIEYLSSDSDIKRLPVTSLEAFYLLRHPFTKKPCLSCFELVKVFSLNSENELSDLDYLRSSLIDISASRYRSWRDTIQNKCDTNKCSHVNSTTPSILIYDLQSVCTQMKRSIGTVSKRIQLLNIFTDQCIQGEKPDYWRYAFADHDPKPIESVKHSELHQEPSIDYSKDETNQNDEPQLHTSTLTSASLSRYQTTVWRCATQFERCFSTNLLYQHELFDYLDNESIAEHNKFVDLHRITLNIINVLRLEQCEQEMQTSLFINTLDQMPLLLNNDNHAQRIDVYNTCLIFIRELTPKVKQILDKIYSI